MYLDKFTVPHCHFQKPWGEITKKAICPKICEILSITCEFMGHAQQNLRGSRKMGDGFTVACMFRPTHLMLIANFATVLLRDDLLCVDRKRSSLTEIQCLCESKINFYEGFSVKKCRGINCEEVCVSDVVGSEASGWAWVLAAVHIPDLAREDFLNECVRQGSYLTLFAYVLQQLPLSRSPNNEFQLMKALISWTAKARPR